MSINDMLQVLSNMTDGKHQYDFNIGRLVPVGNQSGVVYDPSLVIIDLQDSIIAKFQQHYPFHTNGLLNMIGIVTSLSRAVSYLNQGDQEDFESALRHAVTILNHSAETNFAHVEITIPVAGDPIFDLDYRSRNYKNRITYINEASETIARSIAFIRHVIQRIHPQ